LKALITGAGGFVGGHLCQYLLAHTDWDLLGTVYPQQVETQPTEPRLRLQHLDLREPEGVQALLEKAQPDHVFHLAAQSIPAASFDHPWDTLETNIRSQLNILHSVRVLGLRTCILVIGSNEEYGHPKKGDLPFTEESSLRPSSPYAVSKVTQDLMGLQFHLAYGLDVIRIRPFNHTGPGQSPQFVIPAFASQIARIEAGLQEPVLKVGNLSAARDFSDVRDIVYGYHLAATKGKPGDVYNLASGQPHKISAVLDMLLSFTNVNIRVETDPERYRPIDVPVVYGSAEKFYQLTGWVPEFSFEQTLKDTLDYWREQVKTQTGGSTHAQ
jgi:GDP-4-dehydro-6-deoxy-D-mannose reductase